jgi:hypothetical protein
MKLPTRATHTIGVMATVLVCGLGLSLGSCIAENLDGCPEGPPLEFNVQLRIVTDYELEGNFTRAAAKQDWYDDAIESVSVFVFDETEAYVTSWEGEIYTLGQEYLVPMSLPEGHTYHFLAWTNHIKPEYEHSHWGDALTIDPVTGEPRRLMMDDITMDLVMPEDGTRTFTEDLPHLHYGVERMEVSDQTSLHECVIKLSTNTYKVNFVLKDLPMDEQNDEFEVTVSDYNSRHKIADASVVHDTEPYFQVRSFAPVPESVGTGSVEQLASLVMLQIADSTESAFSSFEVVNTTTGDVVYPQTEEQENNLLDIIRVKYDISTDEELEELLSSEYEFTITFTFGASLSIDITIGDYEYIENPTPLR